MTHDGARLCKSATSMAQKKKTEKKKEKKRNIVQAKIVVKKSTEAYNRRDFTVGLTIRVTKTL